MCSLFSFDPTIIINFIINNFCSIYIYITKIVHTEDRISSRTPNEKKKKKKNNNNKSPG